MTRTGRDAETCLRWVERHQQVRAFDASDRAITYSTGTVIGYYSQPTLVIETETGERLVWAARLCEEGPIQLMGQLTTATPGARVEIRADDPVVRAFDRAGEQTFPTKEQQ